MTTVTRPRAVRRLITLFGLLALASCAVDKGALARSIGLRDVDLSTVADGTYTAGYAIAPPAMAANKTVRVNVTVEGGACRSVEIVEPAQLGKDKVFAALVERIVESGHLSMDVVSGATITSAAILKAVQIAVNGKRN